MDEPCSRDVLRACLRDIARTNRWTFAYRPLLNWLNSVTDLFAPLKEPLRILDVGCGYGDGLRRIEQWAGARRIAVELTGLDLNPDATAIAAEASLASSRIQWVTADILTYFPEQPPHLVVSSLFTHHLAEHQIVQFLRWMETTRGLDGSSTICPARPFPTISFALREADAAPSFCAVRWPCFHRALLSSPQIGEACAPRPA
jgi:SAM-dependent methyltransferase